LAREPFTRAEGCGWPAPRNRSRWCWRARRRALRREPAPAV